MSISPGSFRPEIVRSPGTDPSGEGQDEAAGVDESVQEDPEILAIEEVALALEALAGKIRERGLSRPSRQLTLGLVKKIGRAVENQEAWKEGLDPARIERLDKLREARQGTVPTFIPIYDTRDRKRGVLKSKKRYANQHMPVNIEIRPQTMPGSDTIDMEAIGTGSIAMRIDHVPGRVLAGQSPMIERTILPAFAAHFLKAVVYDGNKNQPPTETSRRLSGLIDTLSDYQVAELAMAIAVSYRLMPFHRNRRLDHIESSHEEILAWMEGKSDVQLAAVESDGSTPSDKAGWIGRVRGRTVKYLHNAAQLIEEMITAAAEDTSFRLIEQQGDRFEITTTGLIYLEEFVQLPFDEETSIIPYRGASQRAAARRLEARYIQRIGEYEAHLQAKLVEQHARTELALRILRASLIEGKSLSEVAKREGVKVKAVKQAFASFNTFMRRRVNGEMKGRIGGGGNDADVEDFLPEDDDLADDWSVIEPTGVEEAGETTPVDAADATPSEPVLDPTPEPVTEAPLVAGESNQELTEPDDTTPEQEPDATALREIEEGADGEEDLGEVTAAVGAEPDHGTDELQRQPSSESGRWWEDTIAADPEVWRQVKGAIRNLFRDKTPISASALSRACVRQGSDGTVALRSAGLLKDAVAQGFLVPADGTVRTSDFAVYVLTETGKQAVGLNPTPKSDE